MQTSYVTVTDLFCGAGGSSLGASQAHRSVVVRIAVNHWRTAVDTHARNFLGTDHDCADISACNPWRYPPTTILIASPECTNYTRAKGKRRANLPTTDLWGKPTLSEAEERSRVTMWDPIRFAERHLYQFVIIENVVDIKLWSLYPAWIAAWENLGYAWKECYFNSMFFHPTPQSRDRFYFVAWRKGMRAPDLDYRPPAHCPRCDGTVEAVQSWKKTTRKFGKYGVRNQYVYCCPVCATETKPFFAPAATAVDWSIPIERIGDRKKPLVERTHQRIQAGLRKFANQATLVNFVNSGGHEWMVRSVDQPWPTQIANRTWGLAIPPFAVDMTRPDRLHPLSDPMRTQVASEKWGLVMPPFLTSLNHSDDRSRSVEEPAPTIMPHTRPALVVPPFVTSYYGGRDALSGIDEALPTIPTANRHALIQPPSVDPATIRVEDCGFRMFKVHEIKRAMAFPDDYELLGTQDDQIKLLGNAVTPPPMRWMVERCLAVFG